MGVLQSERYSEKTTKKQKKGLLWNGENIGTQYTNKGLLSNMYKWHKIQQQKEYDAKSFPLLILPI